MAIAERSLAELNADDVAQALVNVQAVVQEDNSNIDVSRGVFHDLVLYYHSVLATQLKANIDDYQAARSLKQITADPALADPDLVDDVLSNFRLTRKEGGVAAGEVTVVRDNNLTLTLATGTVFTANGLDYSTSQVYTAKAESSQINTAADRLITTLGDGTYAFTVPVTASAAGSAYLLPKNTLLVPAILPGGYVTSYASSDFSGGTDTETNQELIDRLQQGIAARTLSNRVNMTAMLREIDAFSRIVAMSIIGYGDPEMLRDRHWIWPVSGGGRCDWYVRSTPRVEHLGLTVTATLVEKTDDLRGVWQFGLAREDAPGFYEVRHVRQTDAEDVAGGYAIESDTRGVDLSGDGWFPDVATADEGEYTSFQTAVIKFTDADTDTTSLTLGATRDYAIDAVTVPLIADVQETVSSRDVRHYGADCLVKAPVPCFLQLSFSVFKRNGQADPDEVAVKEALCEAVNGLGFVGRLYASTVHDVVHNYLLAGQAVGAIDMFGRVRHPGGTVSYLRDGDVLVVPDAPESMTTARTVQFFVEPDDIAVTVVTLPSTNV